MDYYEEYEKNGNNLSFDRERISEKNTSLVKTIVHEPFNNNLLLILGKNGGWEDTFLDFELLSEVLVGEEYYNTDDKSKVISRLKVFENAGLFGYNSASGEHWDVGWFYLSNECLELLK